MSTIPFIDLASQQSRLRKRIEQAISRVLDHGQYVMGPEVVLLEEELAMRADRRHAITCASGTDALVMALMALGVGPGDSVVVPDFTFVATAEAVKLVGATPIFADIDPVSYNLDPRSVDSAWSRAEPPSGVIAVDLFGNPARYCELEAVTRRRGAWMLVDSAQSFGAVRGGRPAPAHGVMATTSFFPAKPLGAYGDGGAVFTDDDSLADAVRSIRTHGQGSDRYDHVRLGLTGRLDTIQAAILLVKLDVFDEELVERERTAARYHDQISDVVKSPTIDGDAESTWAQYTIEVEFRDAVRSHLEAVGVPTAIHYPRPISSQHPYRDDPCVSGGTPVAMNACSRVLSLPLHPYLDRPTQDRIVEEFRSAVHRSSAL